MKRLWHRPNFRWWLAIMGTATILLITSYTLVQQSTRLGANDAPRLTALTTKKQLEKGANPNDVVPSDKINLKTEDSVFLIVTDGSEHVLASSASLNGQTKLPPAGTFFYAIKHGSDRFTWQPQSRVRLATYLVPYGKSPNDGFIIAGQSLKEAEKKIQSYTWLSMVAWLAILAWSSFILLLPYTDTPTKK